MKSLTEPAREIEILEEVDVLVCGGGVSGCAAAVSAARAGARTVLLERNGCLGGVATATLMSNFGNLIFTRDGELTTGGFVVDVIDRLSKRAAAPQFWRTRATPALCMDSEALKLLLIEMCGESGVQPLTHAMATAPIVEDGRVRGVFVESKSGRQAILAKTTVDATGEADIAFRAGAETAWVDSSSSMLFKMARVDMAKFVAHFEARPETFPVGRDWLDPETFFENWRERGIFFFPHGGGQSLRRETPGWEVGQDAVARGEYRTEIDDAVMLDLFGLYGLRGNDEVVVNTNGYMFPDLDIRRLSRYELHSQQVCAYSAAFMIRAFPGFENARLTQIGHDLGLRGCRRIVGQQTMAAGDVDPVEPPMPRDDVIARFPSKDRKKVSGAYFRNHCCEAPLGILLPRGVEGLIVGSGKSISTEPTGLLRSMVCCMGLGQAAGVAAAMASRTDGDVHALPVGDVQRELLRQDVDLGDGDRVKALGLT